MTRREEAAIEAVQAFGNTEACYAWFRKWKPDYPEQDLTSVQYSLSLCLRDHAVELFKKL